MAECPYVLCLCVLTQLGLTPWVPGAWLVKGFQGGWEGHGERPLGPGAAERQGLDSCLSEFHLGASACWKLLGCGAIVWGGLRDLGGPGEPRGQRPGRAQAGLSLLRGAEADGGLRAESAAQVGTRRGPLLPANVGGQGFFLPQGLGGVLALVPCYLGSGSPSPKSSPSPQRHGAPRRRECPAPSQFRFWMSRPPASVSPRTQRSRSSNSPPPDPGVQVPSSLLPLGPDVPAPTPSPHPRIWKSRSPGLPPSNQGSDPPALTSPRTRQSSS